MIQFVHHWVWLLLIPAIALFYWMCVRKRPAIVIMNIAPFRKSRRKKHFPGILETAIFLALLCGIAALSRPRLPQGRQLVRAKGVDIVLALDMSGSMSTIDRPHGMSENKFVEQLQSGKITNRLESAKNAIREFISRRPNDRIGLIGFADLAYSFVPPTLDHALLLERLQALKPGELGNATGIASPIGNAVKRLKNSDSPRRVMVLFTDGENTADNQLTPQAAAETARDLNVIIHTVGIGSDNAYMLLETPFGSRLTKVQNDLDENLLRELAKISGGRYFAAADNDGMTQVMQEINSLEQTNFSSPQPLEFLELAPFTALAGAVILMLGIIFNSVGKVRLP